MKDLVCKTCGSNLKFNEKIKIKCDYCGNEYLLDSIVTGKQIGRAHV